MEMQLVQVPVPKPRKAPKAVKTGDKARPFWAIHVPAMKKWFCDADLSNAVAAYLNEVDHGNDGLGYGASDIGSAHPLYKMMTVSNKERAGTVAYNGNVKLDAVQP